MAIRTNAAAVKGILLRNYDRKNEPDLTPFMTDASDIVDELVAADAKGLLTVGRQEKVERYVAAHLYCLADPTYKQRSTDDASGTVLGNAGKGYDATFYGQQAKRFDPTGKLADQDRAASNTGQKIRVHSLGNHQSPNYNAAVSAGWSGPVEE